MNNIAICLCSDNNYVQHLGAVISSVLKSKDENDYIKFYIVDGGISEDNKQKLNIFETKYDCQIQYIVPDMEKLKNCHTFKGDYISLATYFRLFIPELIPSEDKVIYLDCDIIVRKSLYDFYTKDFGNNLVLGVEDVSEKAHSARLNLERYVNAGAVLLNTKTMREENSVEKIIDWIATNNDKIECHDQDVLNAVFAGRIEYIEKVYNAQVRRNNLSEFDKIKDPVILHFISPKKPWSLWKPINSTHWAKEYFTALESTPWENFIDEYKKQSLLYAPLKIFYPTGAIKILLNNIFSVKNSKDKQQKIITILGFSLKISRNKIKR